MSYSLNSLKRGSIREYLMDYYTGGTTIAVLVFDHGSYCSQAVLNYKRDLYVHPYEFLGNSDNASHEL